MKFSKILFLAIASLGLVSLGAVGLQRWMASRATPPVLQGRMMMHQGGMMHQMHNITSEFDYLTQMIPHHQEAIDTAKILLARSQRPQMRQFAQEIIQVQSEEIKQMQIWLREWYPGRSSTVTYTAMMRDLGQLEGSSLDERFLQDMIMHHMGAVMMSQMLLNQNLVKHEPVRPFAQEIATAQRQEIKQMQAWLKDWFGVTGMPAGMMHSH
uniref:DUF305 domain-containing protein n=1 Tax=Cyanothece sp. (strain PCC 7425 / ATCC 29141) TaxID=395961 RepID=B8HXZ4_CYAP4